MTTTEYLSLAWLVYALVEAWLGRTTTVRAGSVVELVFHVIESLVRRRNVIVDRSQKIAKETDDVMVLIVDIVRKIKAGVKPADLATQEIPLLVQAMSGGEQIPEEYAANPEAVLSTVMGRMGELTAVLVTSAKK